MGWPLQLGSRCAAGRGLREGEHRYGGLAAACGDHPGTAGQTSTVYFAGRNDDGLIVNINNTAVISDWAQQGPTYWNSNGSFTGVGGQWYPIVINWYEWGGSAWTTGGTMNTARGSSAGTSADAVRINASAGGIDIDAETTLQIDSRDTTHMILAADHNSTKELKIDALNLNAGGSAAAVITIGATSGTAVNIGHSTSEVTVGDNLCLLYTSPSPRDRQKSRMPSSA